VKKLYILIIAVTVSISEVKSSDFIRTEDSYFGPYQTRPTWTAGFGFFKSKGLSSTFLDNYEIYGMNLIYKGNVFPEPYILKNVWIRGVISYKLQEDATDIYQFVCIDINIGTGIKGERLRLPRSFIIYLGAGLSLGSSGTQKIIHDSSITEIDYKINTWYPILGLEWEFSKELVPFIEIRYVRWSITRMDPYYIPRRWEGGTELYDLSYEPDKDKLNFLRQEEEFGTFTFGFGLNLYFGI